MAVAFMLGDHPSSAAVLDAIEQLPDDRRPVTTPGTVQIVLGEGLPEALVARARELVGRVDRFPLEVTGVTIAEDNPLPSRSGRTRRVRRITELHERNDEATTQAPQAQVRTREPKLLDLDCSGPRPDAAAGLVVLCAQEAGDDPDVLADAFARRLPDAALGRMIVVPAQDLAARWRELYEEHARTHPGMPLGVIAPPDSGAAVVRALRQVPPEALPHLLAYRSDVAHLAGTLPGSVATRGYRVTGNAWIHSATLASFPRLMADVSQFRREAIDARSLLTKVTDPTLRRLLERLRADTFVPPGHRVPLVRPGEPGAAELSPWVVALAEPETHGEGVLGFVITCGDAPYAASARRQIRLVDSDDAEAESLAKRDAGPACSNMLVFGRVSPETMIRLATHGHRPDRVHLILREHPSLLAAVETEFAIGSDQPPKLDCRIDGERTDRIRYVADHMRSRGVLIEGTSPAGADDREADADDAPDASLTEGVPGEAGRRAAENGPRSKSLITGRDPRPTRQFGRRPGGLN